jgi:hypothetical protein
MGIYTFFNPGEVAAAGVVFPLVGGILVALRIRIRLMKMKKLGIEDWLVFPALVGVNTSKGALPDTGDLGIYDRNGNRDNLW